MSDNEIAEVTTHTREVCIAIQLRYDLKQPYQGWVAGFEISCVLVDSKNWPPNIGDEVHYEIAMPSAIAALSKAKSDLARFGDVKTRVIMSYEDALRFVA